VRRIKVGIDPKDSLFIRQKENQLAQDVSHSSHALIGFPKITLRASKFGGRYLKTFFFNPFFCFL